MYDRVVTINNTHWPACRKPGATLLDLRMLDQPALNSASSKLTNPQKQKKPKTGGASWQAKETASRITSS